ncbi:MAG: HIT domain-containing protein [Alphaproteobacteria bacterium]|nr:HIT domain-containing protein [Alphaproteobacteria bacterium]
MWKEYDDQNIFAKILRGEIPSEKVYESATVLAFKNIRPLKKIHILVVPKIPAISFQDFVQNNTTESIGLFFKEIEKVASLLHLTGYQVNFNVLPDGGQEVPHLHAHLMADS